MPIRSFACDPSAVRAARRFLRDECALVGEPRQIAELLVSELVTNVVQHARTEFTVELRVEHGVLRVVVEDGVATDIAASELRADPDGGRGLRIVDALADAWGTVRTPRGKQVWFSVALEQE